MSQSHLLKFGIIPVILMIAAAVTVQRLTTANAENTGQQNIPITKVFSNLTTGNSAKSQTEAAITQASEEISAAKNNSANQTPELSSAEISAKKNSSTSSTHPGEKLSESKSEITAVADNSGNNSKVELPQLKDAPASTTVKSPVATSPVATSPVASAESKPKSPSQSGLAEKTQSVAKNSQKPESAPVVVPYRELPPMPQPQTTSETNSEINSDAIEKDWSENSLLFELFATPDAPGVLAIGTAEGTVTASGQLTSSYWGHTDPGNGAHNLGTFSYQHGAPTPRQADWRQLRRLQGQVETILGQAQAQRVKLSALELVAGADLLNQAPAAGMSYVENLKKARDRGISGINAVLEARVMSFVNPETGVLEASGFGNNWEVLRQDQWRRLVELHQTLQLHGVI